MPILKLAYRTVKNIGSKQLWQIRNVGSLAEKIFGKLKSIGIGNVIEIVKIGKKLGKML